ncbi:MAG: hypothetical protein J7L71_06015 [Spirochaetaceae bacterium]|nr:hypothetical protein [Spirochaetaceae bacterium]
MKIYKNILYLILIIVFSGFFSSCDYLLPAPLGRNNPFDNEAQIGRFNVAVSGSDSMVTNWDWHDALPTIADDRVIDKIRIVHQENSRPSSRNPLNPDNVQEFTSTSNWSYNWTSLKNDRDHHFALYAHEKSGLWLSPKYIDGYIDSFVQDNNIQLLPVSPPSNPTEFILYEVTNLPSKNDVTGTGPYAWSAGNFLILEFNINEIIYFDQFLLHLNNTVVSTGNLTIYALKKDYQHITTNWADMVSDSTIDYDSAISRQITSLNQVFDIPEAANSISLYYSHSIAIKVDTPLTSVNINAWTIDTHFWGNNP